MKGQIKAATNLAFLGMKSLQKTVTFNSLGDGTYDLATKTASRIVLATRAIKAFDVGFTEEEEATGLVAPTFMKLIAKTGAFTSEPETDDEFVVDGVTWKVHKVKKEVSQSVYRIYLKKR